jgi:hypothetical protein
MPNGHEEEEERERLLQALEKSIAVVGCLFDQADELDKQASQLDGQAQVLRARAVTTRAVAQAARSILANLAEAHYGRGSWRGLTD